MSYEKPSHVSSSNDQEQSDGWTDLFNTICIEKNHISNTDLAYLYCQKLDKTSQKEMESATRNISNWRSGANLPSRKNFRLLTEILEISKDKELRASWNAAYNEAIQAKPAQQTGQSEAPNPHALSKLFDRQSVISHIFHVTLFVVTVTGTILLMDWLNDDMRKLADNPIVWRKNITMTVGQEIVVHGKKGSCGRMPPAIEIIQKNLPQNLITGILKTGSLGLRASNSCNGLTPAREIVFQAIAPGQETFFLFGNDINVQVTSEPGKENYAVE
jgi:hypothetical protein